MDDAFIALLTKRMPLCMYVEPDAATGRVTLEIDSYAGREFFYLASTDAGETAAFVQEVADRLSALAAGYDQ